MKIAKYARKSAAQKYADDLAKVFPRREFEVVCHPYDFGWAVSVSQDGKHLAYAGKRKGKIGAKLDATAVNAAAEDALDDFNYVGSRHHY